MSFADKHVVITGASGGLGGAVVERLVADGATVHVPLVEAEIPGYATWLRGERVVATPKVDVGDEAAMVAFYAALPSLWASVHLVGGYAMAGIVETSLADFDKQMALNARSCFLACREAVRAMRRGAGSGGGGGRIVNVAARPAVAPVGGMIAYAAAKAAVASITQSLAVELTPERIWVNAIVPSIIDTPANRKSMPNADFDSWPKPAELAAAIGFLVSAENALTTGTLLPVYGRA